MHAFLYLILIVLVVAAVRRLIRRLVRKGVSSALAQADGSDRGVFIALGLAAIAAIAILLRLRAREEHAVGRSAESLRAKPSTATSMELPLVTEARPPKHSASDREWLDRARTECFLGKEAVCLEVAEAEVEAHGGEASAGAQDFAMACTKERGSGCSGLIRGANALLERNDLRLARMYGEKACDAGAGEGCFIAGNAHAANYRSKRRAEDASAATAFFKRACAQGYALGCAARP